MVDSDGWGDMLGQQLLVAVRLVPIAPPCVYFETPFTPAISRWEGGKYQRQALERNRLWVCWMAEWR
jgi:hypothetical protein